MRKMLICSFTVAAAVLVLTAPAGAKGLASARFTGPGLPPGGITIRGGPETDANNGMLFLAAVFGAKTAGPWAFGQDRSDLGPPYRLVVAPDWDPASHVVAVVYPYAHGGPWMYTPPDQNIGPGTETVPGGWWQVGHRMIGSFSYRMAHQFFALLVRHGFPSQAPAYTASTAPLPGQPVDAGSVGSSANAVQPTPSSGGGSWPLWAWILIAVAIGGAILLIAERQRHRVAA